MYHSASDAPAIRPDCATTAASFSGSSQSTSRFRRGLMKSARVGERSDSIDTILEEDEDKTEKEKEVVTPAKGAATSKMMVSAVARMGQLKRAAIVKSESEDGEKSKEAEKEPAQATDDSAKSVMPVAPSIDKAESEDDEEDDELMLSAKREEEDTTLHSSDFVFDPDGDVAYYWLCIITVAVIYNCWIIILRIGFTEMREDVLDPVKLSRNYRRKPEFVKDMISIAPVGTIATFIAELTDSAIVDIGEIDESDIYVPIVRLPRLIKFHTMTKCFEVTDSRTSNPNTVRAFKLTLYLSVVIHWIACFYYMVSSYEGLGINDWVFPNKTEDQHFRSKYIRSLYWSTMTLTTIGGTANPETTLEYVFTGVTFLIGVFVFAAVVGNVGDVISNMNAARQDFMARMDQIKFYMDHRRIPEVLQNRVKRWADYSWTRTQAIDEISMLEMLPERLRSEIAIHVHLETLKKVKIFEECEEGLLHELVLKLRSQIYSPGDHICRTGEIGREMYIINHGKVEILVNSPSQPSGKMVVATLSEGNYFGEISLLKLDAGQNKRTADVRSVGYSELLCLSRKELMSALVEYPDAKDILEAQARERMQKNKEVRRTSTADSTSGDKPSSSSTSPTTEAPKPPPKPAEEKPVPPPPPPPLPALMKGKKDTLWQLLKSDDFQRAAGPERQLGKELSQLKEVVKDMRSFDSQMTKERVQQLSEKCDDLKKKLKQRNVELRDAIQRINELETFLLLPENGPRYTNKLNGLASVRTRRYPRNNNRKTNGHVDLLIAAAVDSTRRSSTGTVNVEENGNSYTDQDNSLTYLGPPSINQTNGELSDSELNDINVANDSSQGRRTRNVAVPGISINGILEQEPADVTLEQGVAEDTDPDSNSEISPGSSGMFGYDCANIASILTDTSRNNSESSSGSSSEDSDGG
ncbi:cyclic nucleotide-gated channel rod photoreceptor subunit alpha-like isoform X2 [Lineus longissimus]|uniref:cyclic nucleotide-gated channel rod photoreceptor subunit alpha-like isoform X2 n=1 Tax=Lineus longissimus TaxID=88925 RepID=UPI00315CA10A